MAILTAATAWIDGVRREHVAIATDDAGRVADIFPAAQAPADAPRHGLLLPGLINAHCHLEYSHFAGKLPRGRIAFGEWLDTIAMRATDGLREVFSGMEMGADEVRRSGSTTILRRLLHHRNSEPRI